MEKVVAVILNYMNYRETFQCVDSVLLQENADFEIIIVDNGSPNESYGEFLSRYRKNPLVHVLKTNQNYGFAKGNNVGIHYARRKLSADFVLLLNSDTELMQKDAISVLLSKYEENAAVISGRVVQERSLIPETYYEYVEFPDTLFLYFQFICDDYGFWDCAKKFSRLLRKERRAKVLHGSCLMLTPSFFKHYPLLYPRTFLYSEEVLLYISCRNAGLIQVQAEEAAILHKGKQSSKYLYGNKDSVKRKYQIASYKYVVWESFKAYLRGCLCEKHGG